MKYFILFILLFFTQFNLIAQVPNGLNYQAIVRDNSGKPLITKNVTMRFTVLKGSASGTTVYAEEHHGLTNEFGLVNALIGYGFPLQGRFDQIDWSSGNYFLKIEMDPNGGINYELSSVSPFLSVPYALYAEHTKLEAGAGIQIDGNKISNTGDPDPLDDLKSGSPAGGDLTGNLPSPKVNGLQGRPVMDINPLLQQALIWNGNQWMPGTVDTDPTNDLTINSNASGDLSGIYPGPKVTKLNGYPLNSTAPDSGDVLLFAQGEWKHSPIGSGPSNSDWKRIGNDIQLQDPVNVKQILTGSASIVTQNKLIATKGSDSTMLSPVGITMNKLSGPNKISLLAKPESIMLNRNNDLLMGLNVFGTNATYSEMEFWNLDPAYNATTLYVNPYQILFGMKSPDRFSGLTANDFEIYRKTKDSPMEFTGLYAVDSALYLYKANNDIVTIKNDITHGGELFLHDKDGKERISLTTGSTDQTRPFLGMFTTKFSTSKEVIELSSYNNTGEFYLINGNNDKVNLYAGFSNFGANYAYLTLIGTDNQEHVGMYVDQSGDGIVFADVKSFRMKDPINKNQEIWYACVEGPEAAAYERGTNQLINGEAFIKYTDHFMKVANTSKVTIQLTPGSEDTYGLAIVEKRSDGFKVKELQKGKGNFSFDWEVKAVRKGHENFQVYHKQEKLGSFHNSKGTEYIHSQHRINK